MPKSTMLDTSAQAMYKIHCMMLNVEDIGWDNLTDGMRAYWMMLADTAITVWEEPDEHVINAVLTRMREPAVVQFNNWRDQHKALFLRYLTTALNAGRNRTW